MPLRHALLGLAVLGTLAIPALRAEDDQPPMTDAYAAAPAATHDYDDVYRGYLGMSDSEIAAIPWYQSTYQLSDDDALSIAIIAHAAGKPFATAVADFVGPCHRSLSELMRSYQVPAETMYVQAPPDVVYSSYAPYYYGLYAPYWGGYCSSVYYTNADCHALYAFRVSCDYWHCPPHVFFGFSAYWGAPTWALHHQHAWWGQTTGVHTPVPVSANHVAHAAPFVAVERSVSPPTRAAAVGAHAAPGVHAPAAVAGATNRAGMPHAPTGAMAANGNGMVSERAVPHQAVPSPNLSHAAPVHAPAAQPGQHATMAPTGSATFGPHPQVAAAAPHQVQPYPGTVSAPMHVAPQPAHVAPPMVAHAAPTHVAPMPSYSAPAHVAPMPSRSYSYSAPSGGGYAASRGMSAPAAHGGGYAAGHGGYAGGRPMG
jgi:hypothetical protein